MKKKFTSVLIVMVIFAAVFIVFASWSKLTDKTYADTALTIGMFLELGIVAIGILWLFIENKRRKANL